MGIQSQEFVETQALVCALPTDRFAYWEAGTVRRKSELVEAELEEGLILRCLGGHLRRLHARYFTHCESVREKTAFNALVFDRFHLLYESCLTNKDTSHRKPRTPDLITAGSSGVNNGAAETV